MLDFGCGQGDFLNTLADLRPDLTLFGFDPESGHEAERYTPVDDMAVVADGLGRPRVLLRDARAPLRRRDRMRSSPRPSGCSRPGGEVPDLGAGHRRPDPAAQGGQPGRAVPAAQRLLGRRAAGRLVRGVAPRRGPTTSGSPTRASTSGRCSPGSESGSRSATSPVRPFPALPWWLNSQVFARLRRRLSRPTPPGAGGRRSAGTLVVASSTGSTAAPRIGSSVQAQASRLSGGGSSCMASARQPMSLSSSPAVSAGSQRPVSATAGASGASGRNVTRPLTRDRADRPATGTAAGCGCSPPATAAA